jgi:hypothetical protein
MRATGAEVGDSVGSTGQQASLQLGESLGLRVHTLIHPAGLVLPSVGHRR